MKTYLSKSYTDKGIWMKVSELSKAEQALLTTELFITNELDREAVVIKHLRDAQKRRLTKDNPL